MADSEWGLELAKIGYLAQERSDFYAVALSFTLLGLAVQTAHFGSSPISDLFELAGWIALLVSGVSGVSRLEFAPHTYQLMGLQQTQQDRLTGLRREREKGMKTVTLLDTSKVADINTVIAKDEADLGMVEQKYKATTRAAGISYRIRNVGFLVGLLSLVIARGVEPFLALLR